ncbi:unnamed protein product, partial [marine sediment metagenome]
MPIQTEQINFIRDKMYRKRLLKLLQASVMDLDMECAYCGGKMYEADGPCQECGQNALQDED